MDLTYAHCIKAEPHKPDVAPYTRYVFRTVKLECWQVAPDETLGETEPTYRVDLDGLAVGWGDTLDDALGESRYRLMDQSRTAAGFDFDPSIHWKAL